MFLLEMCGDISFIPDYASLREPEKVTGSLILHLLWRPKFSTFSLVLHYLSATWRKTLNLFQLRWENISLSSPGGNILENFLKNYSRAQYSTSDKTR
jgi:hypothetical protein